MNDFIIRKANIYLFVVVFCFVLALVTYQLNVEYWFETNPKVIALVNYGGLLFLAIPHTLYIIYRWKELKNNKGFLIMQIGYLVMALLILYVFIDQITHMENNIVNLSTIVYYLLVYGLVLCFIVGAVYGFLDGYTTMNNKVVLIVEAVVLVLFITSTIKSFYPISEGVIVSNIFNFPLRWKIFTSQMFNNLQVLLLWISTLVSITYKYKSLNDV